jgi:hypothetical protein
MSDYPPAPPYGASYGGQPQTNPPYHTPYQNPYMQQDDGRSGQTHMAPNYDASMAAFGYNNAIPGFGANALPPAAPPLPLHQGWNQHDAGYNPSYSTPQNNMPYAGYGGNGYQPPNSYTAPPQGYQQNTHHNAPYDEGELSEGDAYAPQPAIPAATTNYGAPYYQGNDGTGYMNTAQRAVYPNGQDYNSQQYASGMSWKIHTPTSAND